jgi:hypothetical protein
MDVGPPPKEAEVERLEGLSGVSGVGWRKEAEVGGDALFIYYDNWSLCALAWLLNVDRTSGGRRQGVLSAFVGVNALLGRRVVGGLAW